MKSAEREHVDAATERDFARASNSYERTTMSWIRTATSLITFGFTIYKFFQLEALGRPAQHRLIGPRQFSLMLVSSGMISLVLATWEYRQSIRMLGNSTPAVLVHSRLWSPR